MVLLTIWSFLILRRKMFAFMELKFSKNLLTKKINSLYEKNPYNRIILNVYYQEKRKKTNKLALH
jgi:hypothetical protein